MLRRTEALVYFKMVSFRLLETEGDFSSNIHCENVVEYEEIKTHQSVGLLKWLAPPGVFTFQACSPCTPNPQQFTNYSLDFPIWHWSLKEISALVHSESLYSPCLSLQFGGQQFDLWPRFSYGSRRVVDFSICSAWYLLLGWNGNF